MSKTFEERKKQLVKQFRRAGLLKSKSIERAFLRVPRENFVPEQFIDNAYDDTPLPIGYGQTISAIHMSIIFCENLDLKPGQKVLEIGTGSGYNAAFLAEIVAPDDSEVKGHVYSIERIPKLAEFAKQNLKKSGYSDRVTVIIGDGTLGYPSAAPYDRIVVTASGPRVPPPLLEQLQVGGRLIIPLGANSFWQELYLFIKESEKRIIKKNLGGVAFVPLIGQYGWNNNL
ncbi:MAG: protein-L-isoaspartate O-methyltransferase [Candidatus Asgardarchaeia archaeon]